MEFKSTAACLAVGAFSPQVAEPHRSACHTGSADVCSASRWAEETKVPTRRLQRLTWRNTPSPLAPRDPLTTCTCTPLPWHLPAPSVPRRPPALNGHFSSQDQKSTRDSGSLATAPPPQPRFQPTPNQGRPAPTPVLACSHAHSPLESARRALASLAPGRRRPTAETKPLKCTDSVGKISVGQEGPPWKLLPSVLLRHRCHAEAHVYGFSQEHV